MAISLPDARQLSDEVLDALRIRALHGRELGYSEAQLAELLGVARETVSRWDSAYAAGGLDALPHDRTGRPEGSGRALTDEQAAHLQQILDHRTPEQAGVAAPLWNRRAVRALIRKEYGLELAERTVGLYLRRWGYTPKRPRRRARAQEPEEVREWLEETYPEIERQAAAEGATIFWCDETGVAADQHPGTGYARVGQPATAEAPDSHIRVNVIAAISNEGAARFMTYTEAMTAALFITFLERLLRGAPGKIHVIVDWLRAHEAKAVQEWAGGNEDRIALWYLPRYAPELNAEEYLNNDLKGRVNESGLAGSRPELRSRIQGVLRRLAHLPEHIKNYFKHPCLQYATQL